MESVNEYFHIENGTILVYDNHFFIFTEQTKAILSISVVRLKIVWRQYQEVEQFLDMLTIIFMERCQNESLPINQIYDLRLNIPDLPKSLDEICIDENFSSTKGGFTFWHKRCRSRDWFCETYLLDLRKKFIGLKKYDAWYKIKKIYKIPINDVK
ncbi:unnamed protein product [Brachionus calyciflorus]|uniref:Uncharacterized protein n=1 Tax=Brachionus calyciflorus TaxID=104777 RepID=A0A813PET1_9BILA|nr:unnamed protein product [Brachionus calyciflorus]